MSDRDRQIRQIATTGRMILEDHDHRGSHLPVANDDGKANCFDTSTGERFWQVRLSRHFSASLVTANGLVYFLDDDGITKVVRPGKELAVVAESPVGEFCSASPAISQGQVFVRGEKHLFCIGSRSVEE